MTKGAESPPHRQPAHRGTESDDRDRSNPEGKEPEVVRVPDCDDRDGNDVVHHRECEQEDAQGGWQAVRHHGENGNRERGVRGGWYGPTVQCPGICPHHRARYRDDAGNERARHFDRKIDARQWLDQVTSAVITGTYADPKAGRITLRSVLRGVVGPPGLGTRHRARDVAGGEISALRGEADQGGPTLGRRDLDQADERGRPRSRHDQDAVRQGQGCSAPR